MSKRRSKSSLKATTLMSVLNFYEQPPGTGNFFGAAFGASFPSWPPEPSKLPVLTTWIGIQEPFEFVLKFIDPDDRVVSMHVDTVEPSNDWGYNWHLSHFEISPQGTGLHKLQLFVNDTLQLERHMIFSKEGEGDDVEIRHAPALTMFLCSQVANDIGDVLKIDVKNIMGDEGFRKGSPYTLIAEWRNCVKPLRIKFDLLAPDRKLIMSNKHEIKHEGSATNLVNTYMRVRFELGSLPPFLGSGIYWAKITYKGKTEEIPLLLT